MQANGDMIGTFGRPGGHSVLAAAVLAWMLLAPPVPAVAQGSQPPVLEETAPELAGLPIRKIDFVGLHSVAPDTLLYYLDLEEGQPYTLSKINDNIHDLWRHRLIDDIALMVEPLEDGVRLEISIVERPLMISIDYRGIKRLNKSDINDRIATDRIRVQEGDSIDLGELERLAAAIEDIYRERGFRFADATYSMEEESPGQMRVVFSIDEGDKVRIGRVEFDGNTILSDKKLRGAMKKTKKSNLITRIRKRDIYNVVTLEEDLDLVREVYRKAGYKNVVLGEPVLEVLGRAPEDGKDSKRRLQVTIPVDEGTRWKLGEISVRGAETYEEAILLRGFANPRGGWLRSNVIADGIESIRELYQNTGYIFADIETEYEERDDETANLIINVSEGDQYRIGKIEFEGNRRTRDKVLRRELGVHEGFVLNSGALRNSLLRIRQLDYFKIDETDPVNFDFNRDAKTVDLAVKGEEGDRTELQFGAGFSEVDGFFGQLSFRTRNFLGRGETLGVNVQVGRYRDIFELSYFVPWFRDRPQSIGAEIFSRDLDYTQLAGQDFVQKTQGGRFTYGRNLSLFSSASATYSLYDSEDRRQLLTLEGDLVSQEIVRNVSSLRLAYNYDRRNSRLNPTLGLRYYGSVEYAGGVLGGETNYVRPLGQISWFKPVSRNNRLSTTFAVNAQAGWIEPFDEQELFSFDRFFIGGENSVRGFRFRSIWVRDEDGFTVTDEFGFPLGGDKFVNMNLEYHFIANESFRILPFFDAGNVYSEEQDLNFDQLRYSAGLELRVTVPLFGAPLRFIYAVNLDPIEDEQKGPDRFEDFQFAISTSF